MLGHLLLSGNRRGATAKRQRDAARPCKIAERRRCWQWGGEARNAPGLRAAAFPTSHAATFTYRAAVCTRHRLRLPSIASASPRGSGVIMATIAVGGFQHETN